MASDKLKAWLVRLRVQQHLTRLLMYAKRKGLRAPSGLRKLAGRYLRSRESDITLPGWESPLVGAGSLGPAPVPDDAGWYDRTPRSEPPADAPRCLIAVGDFDVAGSSQVAAFLARRLPEYGVRTSVAYTTGVFRPITGSAARLGDELRSQGYDVTEVPVRGAAERLLDAHAFDVISAHGAEPWWVELANERGIPMIDTLHGMAYLLMGLDWETEARRAQRLSRITAVSELVREQYLARLPGLDPDHVVAIPNCIDERRLPRADREAARRWLGIDDEFLFVSLGRFSYWKNTYGLLAAFDEVAAAHPEAHLLVAGRIEMATYTYITCELRDRLAAKDRIHLRDHFEHPSILLAAADAFVLDSFEEGGPLASMEALYAGVPVILPDVGTAREQVGDGRGGYLVSNPLGDRLAVFNTPLEPHLYSTGQANRAELVAAMSRMIAERSSWSARRAELQADAAERFGSEAFISAHAALIRGAIPVA